ncbi:C2 domain-containing protein 3 [Quaeritorhiza haematococci]|nr:C2 domain-containing protein 3 [Quaeritorhiza haematococci]
MSQMATSFSPHTVSGTSPEGSHSANSNMHNIPTTNLPNPPTPPISLPPKVSGPVRGFLRVSVSKLVWSDPPSPPRPRSGALAISGGTGRSPGRSGKSASPARDSGSSNHVWSGPGQPKVRLCWWGDDGPGTIFYPHAVGQQIMRKHTSGPNTTEKPTKSSASRSSIPVSTVSAASEDQTHVRSSGGASSFFQQSQTSSLLSSLSSPNASLRGKNTVEMDASNMDDSSITVRYPVRSSPPQLTAYFRDMGPLVFTILLLGKVVGRASVKDVTSVSSTPSRPINGFFTVYAADPRKDDPSLSASLGPKPGRKKLGELHLVIVFEPSVPLNTPKSRSTRPLISSKFPAVTSSNDSASPAPANFKGKGVLHGDDHVDDIEGGQEHAPYSLEEDTMMDIYHLENPRDPHPPPVHIPVEDSFRSPNVTVIMSSTTPNREPFSEHEGPDGEDSVPLGPILDQIEEHHDKQAPLQAPMDSIPSPVKSPPTTTTTATKESNDGETAELLDRIAERARKLKEAMEKSMASSSGSRTRLDSKGGSKDGGDPLLLNDIDLLAVLDENAKAIDFRVGATTTTAADRVSDGGLGGVDSRYSKRKMDGEGVLHIADLDLDLGGRHEASLPAQSEPRPSKSESIKPNDKESFRLGSSDSDSDVVMDLEHLSSFAFPATTSDEDDYSDHHPHVRRNTTDDDSSFLSSSSSSVDVLSDDNDDFEVEDSSAHSDSSLDLDELGLGLDLGLLADDDLIVKALNSASGKAFLKGQKVRSEETLRRRSNKKSTRRKEQSGGPQNGGKIRKEEETDDEDEYGSEDETGRHIGKRQAGRRKSWERNDGPFKSASDRRRASSSSSSSSDIGGFTKEHEPKKQTRPSREKGKRVRDDESEVVTTSPLTSLLTVEQLTHLGRIHSARLHIGEVHVRGEWMKQLIQRSGVAVGGEVVCEYTWSVPKSEEQGNVTGMQRRGWPKTTHGSGRGLAGLSRPKSQVEIVQDAVEVDEVEGRVILQLPASLKSGRIRLSTTTNNAGTRATAIWRAGADVKGSRYGAASKYVIQIDHQDIQPCVFGSESSIAAWINGSVELRVSAVGDGVKSITGDAAAPSRFSSSSSLTGSGKSQQLTGSDVVWQAVGTVRCSDVVRANGMRWSGWMPLWLTMTNISARARSGMAQQLRPSPRGDVGTPQMTTDRYVGDVYVTVELVSVPLKVNDSPIGVADVSRIKKVGRMWEPQGEDEASAYMAPKTEIGGPEPKASSSVKDGPALNIEVAMSPQKSQTAMATETPSPPRNVTSNDPVPIPAALTPSRATPVEATPLLPMYLRLRITTAHSLSLPIVKYSSPPRKSRNDAFSKEVVEKTRIVAQSTMLYLAVRLFPATLPPLETPPVPYIPEMQLEEDGRLVVIEGRESSNLASMNSSIMRDDVGRQVGSGNVRSGGTKASSAKRELTDFKYECTVPVALTREYVAQQGSQPIIVEVWVVQSGGVQIRPSEENGGGGKGKALVEGLSPSTADSGAMKEGDAFTDDVDLIPSSVALLGLVRLPFQHLVSAVAAASGTVIRSPLRSPHGTKQEENRPTGVMIGAAEPSMSASLRIGSVDGGGGDAREVVSSMGEVIKPPAGELPVMIPDSEYAIVDPFTGNTKGWLKGFMAMGAWEQLGRVSKQEDPKKHVEVEPSQKRQATSSEELIREQRGENRQHVRMDAGDVSAEDTKSPPRQPDAGPSQGSMEHGGEHEDDEMTVTKKKSKKKVRILHADRDDVRESVRSQPDHEPTKGGKKRRPSPASNRTCNAEVTIHRACGLKALIDDVLKEMEERRWSSLSSSLSLPSEARYTSLHFAQEVGPNVFVRFQLFPENSLTEKSVDFADETDDFDYDDSGEGVSKSRRDRRKTRVSARKEKIRNGVKGDRSIRAAVAEYVDNNDDESDVIVTPICAQTFTPRFEHTVAMALEGIDQSLLERIRAGRCGFAVGHLWHRMPAEERVEDVPEDGEEMEEKEWWHDEREVGRRSGGIRRRNMYLGTFRVPLQKIFREGTGVSNMWVPIYRNVDGVDDETAISQGFNSKDSTETRKGTETKSETHAFRAAVCLSVRISFSGDDQTPNSPRRRYLGWEPWSARFKFHIPNVKVPHAPPDNIKGPGVAASLNRRREEPLRESLPQEGKKREGEYVYVKWMYPILSTAKVADGEEAPHERLVHMEWQTSQLAPVICIPTASHSEHRCSNRLEVSLGRGDLDYSSVIDIDIVPRIMDWMEKRNIEVQVWRRLNRRRQHNQYQRLGDSSPFIGEDHEDRLVGTAFLDLWDMVCECWDKQARRQGAEVENHKSMNNRGSRKWGDVERMNGDSSFRGVLPLIDPKSDDLRGACIALEADMTFVERIPHLDANVINRVGIIREDGTTTGIESPRWEKMNASSTKPLSYRVSSSRDGNRSRMLPIRVTIERAMRLPLVRPCTDDEKYETTSAIQDNIEGSSWMEPNTYVSFQWTEGGCIDSPTRSNPSTAKKTFCTRVAPARTNPTWNCEIEIRQEQTSDALLSWKKGKAIEFRVWHVPGACHPAEVDNINFPSFASLPVSKTETDPNLANVLLGVARVDLAPLTLGLGDLYGWYQIVNPVHQEHHNSEFSQQQSQCRGQLLLKISPLISVADALKDTLPHVARSNRIPTHDANLKDLLAHSGLEQPHPSPDFAPASTYTSKYQELWSDPTLMVTRLQKDKSTSPEFIPRYSPQAQSSQHPLTLFDGGSIGDRIGDGLSFHREPDNSRLAGVEIGKTSLPKVLDPGHIGSSPGEGRTLESSHHLRKTIQELDNLWVRMKEKLRKSPNNTDSTTINSVPACGANEQYVRPPSTTSSQPTESQKAATITTSVPSTEVPVIDQGPQPNAPAPASSSIPKQSEPIQSSPPPPASQPLVACLNDTVKSSLSSKEDVTPSPESSDSMESCEDMKKETGRCDMPMEDLMPTQSPIDSTLPTTLGDVPRNDELKQQCDDDDAGEPSVVPNGNGRTSVSSFRMDTDAAIDDNGGLSREGIGFQSPFINDAKKTTTSTGVPPQRAPEEETTYVEAEKEKTNDGERDGVRPDVEREDDVAAVENWKMDSVAPDIDEVGFISQEATSSDSINVSNSSRSSSDEDEDEVNEWLSHRQKRSDKNVRDAAAARTAMMALKSSSPNKKISLFGHRTSVRDPQKNHKFSLEVSSLLERSDRLQQKLADVKDKIGRETTLTSTLRTAHYDDHPYRPTPSKHKLSVSLSQPRTSYGPDLSGVGSGRTNYMRWKDFADLEATSTNESGRASSHHITSPQLQQRAYDRKMSTEQNTTDFHQAHPSEWDKPYHDRRSPHRLSALVASAISAQVENVSRNEIGRIGRILSGKE